MELVLGLNFKKMHACGNDFVIIDCREKSISLSEEEIKSICNRKKGVGCDQLVFINPKNTNNSVAHLSFWNADGSISNTCGNATRCVASLLFEETSSSELYLETEHLEIICVRDGEGKIFTNMGIPRTSWTEIPLSRQLDTLYLPIEGKPTATSFGNPHCTFFVKDLDAFSIYELGPKIENYKSKRPKIKNRTSTHPKHHSD